jgi:hypothetical protein
MARSKIEVAICDRCGAREELRTAAAQYPWGQVAARQVNGPFRIGVESGPKDICPSCVETLDRWWKEGEQCDSI